MDNLSGINFHHELKFFGAAGDITTGSATLVTVCRGNDRFGLLIDAGMFQGKHEELNEASKLIYEKIDAIVITHAHLDHCGLVPYLFKHGYAGKVYGTYEALEHAVNALGDVAEINKQRIRQQLRVINKASKNHRNNRVYDKKKKPVDKLMDYSDELKGTVLYLEEDVEKAAANFTAIPVNMLTKISYGVSVKLIPNSHQDGAATVEVYTEYKERHINGAFSGDIGKSDTYLYKHLSYKPNNKINYLVTECLHGVEEEVEDWRMSYDRFKFVIEKARNEGKKVYAGVFALERAATVDAMLNRMIDEGLWINFCIDSTLANKHLNNYIHHYQSKQSPWFKEFSTNPFHTDNAQFIPNTANHMQILSNRKVDIVVTTSAMGHAGPIRDYFDRHIEDDKAVFVFTGWFPPDSPSSILHEAAKGDTILINGKEYIKRCDTVRLHGLSGHGYYPELMEMVNRYPRVQGIFLNHAEREAKLDFKAKLEEEKEGVKILMPEMNEEYRITLDGIE